MGQVTGCWNIQLKYLQTYILITTAVVDGPGDWVLEHPAEVPINTKQIY